MADVFISYSHCDQKSLEEIFRALKAEQVPIWFDQQIRAGSNWMDEIEAALHNARVIVLCVSPSFLSSDWAKLEIGVALSRARESNVRVVPLVLQDAVIPQSLKRFQFLDARRLRPDDVAKEIKRIVEVATERGT